MKDGWKMEHESESREGKRKEAHTKKKKRGEGGMEEEDVGIC